MKILLVSTDNNLINTFQNDEANETHQMEVMPGHYDPLDVMSYVCKMNPYILLIDDDALKPHTAHILHSIKQVNQNIRVIFLTSDTGIEIGRKISQLGIQFYAIKPINKTDLTESIESIIQLQKKIIN